MSTLLYPEMLHDASQNGKLNFDFKKLGWALCTGTMDNNADQNGNTYCNLTWCIILLAHTIHLAGSKFELCSCRICRQKHPYNHSNSKLQSQEFNWMKLDKCNTSSTPCNFMASSKYNITYLLYNTNNVIIAIHNN
jgi:hypothetical protein